MAVNDFNTSTGEQYSGTTDYTTDVLVASEKLQRKINHR